MIARLLAHLKRQLFGERKLCAVAVARQIEQADEPP